MKNIKEYINNHHKLKKIIKIFGVVVIVCSFLFNTLIVAGLIISSSHNSKDNKVLAYGDYQPQITERKAIEGRFNVFFGFGDFLSLEFAEQTYQLLSGDMTNIGGTGLNPSDFLAGTLIQINNPDIQYAHMDSNGENITIDSSYTFTYLQVKKDNTYSYPSYLIEFCMSDSSGQYLYVYTFYYSRYSIFDMDNTLIYTNWNTSVVLSYSSNFGSSYSTYSMDRGHSLVYFSFSKGLMSNWLGTGNPKWNDYYNQGYNDGYNYGYEVGYDEGEDYAYDQGYYDGIQSAEQGETTMFTLITQAFNSVASILDIQILPNLSLGLLIFTPLIVTVIIVIVKMVKG